MKHGLLYAVVGLFAVGCSGPAGIAGPPAARQTFPTLSPIYFGAGTTVLGLEQKKLVDAHAVWLRRAGKMLLIEGHTDGPADHLLSIEIGEQRARSTKAYLVSKGMAADHIALASHGGGRPTCVERTAACRATNRRVTFSIKSD
jgi:outer membrane protein OmpA-like peptidoglycan-associated protein